MSAASAPAAPRKFAHLHQHTDYSLLDGAARIRDLISWVKEVTPEDPAIAITDHGNMHGAVQFYKTATAAGVKPILGFEAYVTAGSRFDRRRPESRLDGGYFHLTLLAKDFEGYQNLCRLNSRAWLEGFYTKPRIDIELLKEHNAGVIALSGCLGGQLPRTLLDASFERGEELLEQYLQIFGTDRYFIELQDHGLEEQRRLNPMLKELAFKHGLGLVATNDGHYVRREDAKPHDALLAIQTKKLISDEVRFRFPCEEFFVKSPAEMALALPDAEYPEALANTMLIADMCNVELPIGSKRVYQMPEIEVAEGRTLAEQLRVQTYAGLMYRYTDLGEDMWRAYLNHADEVAGLEAAPADLDLEEVFLRLARHGERGARPAAAGAAFGSYDYPHLDSFERTWEDAGAAEKLRRGEFELGVIIAMGFPDYFLIVADFINWAKDNGIAVGPGRGSGAGSIVAYALRITNVEPLGFGLLFERFLNPERVSMPDFDIDFSDTRRGEVIDYVRRKYGEERVVHIATFGTMASKAAIRDAARVLDVPYAEADKASKLIPVHFGKSKSISESLSEVAEFRELYESGGRSFIDVAMALEGLTRHASVHAAGVIIGRNPIDDLAPVFRSNDGQAVIQYDMSAAEDLGFIKMDFLGLRTLSFIEAAVKIIHESRGTLLDPDSFPVDDEKTFDLFCRGDAKGVFQFESSGMIDLLRRVGPRRLEDLIALNALYRPGPMENIPTYARRFSGAEEVSYDEYPQAAGILEPILRETYGIPVYQEQVMQIVQAVAGFSLGEADIMRRVMGKKKVDEMAAQREAFLAGTDARGIARPEAGRIFDLLEKFANYGFNKSHSAAYVILAYQTAYLKAHYPVEFAAALLTIERANSDKVAEYVGDARSMGVDVLPPDINESGADFTPVGSVVRFGLYGIRNVGENVIDEIIRERSRGGRYRDIFDFCRRVDGLNRRAVEYLVKAGAFDSVGDGDRSTLLHNVENAVKWGAAQREQENAGQMSLFGDMELTPPAIEAAAPHSRLELLAMEKDSLGLYISDHPMNSYPGLAEAASSSVAGAEAWFAQQDPSTLYRGRARLALAGILQRVTRRQTRKGTMMARFDIADESGSREVVAFSRAYEEMSDLLADELPVVLIAEASLDEGEFRLVADRIYPWEDRSSLPQVALFGFDPVGLPREHLLELRSRLDEHAGLVPVRFRFPDEQGVVTYAPEGVRFDPAYLQELEESCPWLSVRITLDRDSLLRERRGGNAWAPAAATPAARSVDTPF